MVRMPGGRFRSFFVSLLVIVALGLVALQLGFFTCAGEEFSPDRFLRRSFWFLQIPWIHVRMTPIFREDRTGELESFISVQYPPDDDAPRQPPNWHVVNLRSWRTEWDGDARFLCNLLDARNADGELAWLVWSRNNRPIADVVWPRVGQLARENAYYLIPELMTIAAGAPSPEEFERVADDFISRRKKLLQEPATPPQTPAPSPNP